MAIRYYCDLCDAEVNRASLLSTLSMEEIQTEDARQLNRYDIDRYSNIVNLEICINCRMSILGHINSLKVKK